MENKDIMEIIKQKMAQEFIEVMDEDLKKQVLSEAVMKEIKGLYIDSTVRDLLKAEALKFAIEYSQTEEVANELKIKAKEVVDDMMNGILKTLGKELEDHIKSKYRRLFTNENKYRDVS